MGVGWGWGWGWDGDADGDEMGLSGVGWDVVGMGMGMGLGWPSAPGFVGPLIPGSAAEGSCCVDSLPPPLGDQHAAGGHGHARVATMCGRMKFRDHFKF